MSSKTDRPEEPLDLNALARFAAVVERGGFSAAARALGLPRQSLHRSVAALEQRAGVRLLERVRGNVRPTDAGRRLFTHASAILFEARAARGSLDAARESPRGRLRLTAPHLFAETFLMGPIQEFLAAWPEVRIEADLTVERRELLRDDIDLAIRIGPRPTMGGWVVSVGSLPHVCCAAPSLIERVSAVDHPRKLELLPAIAYGSRREHFEWPFVRDVERVSVVFEPRLRVDSGVLALAATRAGLGVAVLPKFWCASDLASGSLARLVPAWELPSATVWAYSLAPPSDSPTLRAFVELVRSRLADSNQLR